MLSRGALHIAHRRSLVRGASACLLARCPYAAAWQHASLATTNARMYATGQNAEGAGSRVYAKEDATLVPDMAITNSVAATSTNTNASSDTSAAPQQVPVTAKGTDQQNNAPRSATKQAAFAPWEVRALVMALIPLTPRSAAPIPVKQVLYQLPVGVQKQLAAYPGGLAAYCQTHFSQDLEVTEKGLRRSESPTATAAGTPSWMGDAAAGGESTACIDTSPPPPPKTASPSTHSTGGAIGAPADKTIFRAGRNHSTIELLDVLVEYIPTFFVTSDAVAMTIPSEMQALYADTSFNFFLKRFRHYVDVRTTHGHSEIRLKPDFDHPKRGMADAHHGGRLGIPSANNARSLSASSSESTSAAVALRRSAAAGAPRGPLARPPRNSEANLIQYIAPRMPKTYTPLAEVLQDISDIVSRHPSFDPRLGVTGLLEKYPEYFQIVDGKLRARPSKSAPYSLDDLDATTSPLPQVYAKIQAAVDRAAEGRNYLEEADKAAATVPTGKLYALLTAEEKKLVKAQCRSFPRFLRLHGKSIVVSVDSMKVFKFRPEYEPCAETLLDQRLAANAISPDDPILKIPAEMDDKANADWAVRELYDSLPLTQCAELEDVLSLVPPAVRDALPKTPQAIVDEVLCQYPEYFLAWGYPDDESVLVVQRAKVDIPNFSAEDIVRMTYPLIPQGGMELSALRRRVPLALQRYFYCHGTKKVLGGLPQHFRIAGERIIRLG